MRVHAAKMCTHWTARKPKPCCCQRAVQLPQVPHAERCSAAGLCGIRHMQLTVQAVKARVLLDPPPFSSSICLRHMTSSFCGEG